MGSDKLPAIHLYPGDWLRDSIAGCSLAAQGLWLRMLFIAHDSPRYGHLEVNDFAMPLLHVAQRCGCDAAQFASLLEELKMAGVSSINEHGALYSRRMDRDAKLRAVRIKAGRKGGKQTASKRPSKRHSKILANTQANAEDEDEDEDGTKNKKVVTDFDVFWKAFPPGRKKSKARARDEFQTALTKTDVATLIESATQYAASPQGRGQYVQMPSSWLHQECWADDRQAWQDRSKAAEQGEYVEVDADTFAEYHRLGKFLKSPDRHATNVSWVYGTLRDGTKVECRNFPIRQPRLA